MFTLTFTLCQIAHVHVHGDMVANPFWKIQAPDASRASSESLSFHRNLLCNAMFFFGSAFMNRQLDDQAVLGVLQKGRLHQSPGHIFPKDGESISVCAFAWPCMLSFVSTFQNFTMMVGTPKSRTDSCHHDGGLVGWPQEHGNQKRFKFTCCNCSLKIFLLVIPSTTRS